MGVAVRAMALVLFRDQSIATSGKHAGGEHNHSRHSAESPLRSADDLQWVEHAGAMHRHDAGVHFHRGRADVQQCDELAAIGAFRRRATRHSPTALIESRCGLGFVEQTRKNKAVTELMNCACVVSHGKSFEVHVTGRFPRESDAV